MIKEIQLDNNLINERAMEWDVLKNQELAVELVQNLSDTVLDCSDRAFLCSNEIGYKERAFCMKFSDDWKVFMNPIYQKRDNLKLVREYDPLTKKQFIIPRYTDVTICFQNSVGKVSAVKFNEEASIIASQAMDCLEGLHPSDYGLEVTDEFDRATDDERAEVLKFYAESLDNFRKTLEEDLETNEETKQEWDAFRFMRDKAEGKIKSAEPEIKLNRKQRRFFDRLARKFRGKKDEVSKGNKEQ